MTRSPQNFARLTRVWLGSLVVLSFLVLRPDPIAAEPTDAADGTPATTRPDFRFEAPRVILGARGGWAFNRSGGEIYDSITDNLTLNSSAFDMPAFTIDAAGRLTSWLDVVVGFEISSRNNDSKYRSFVDTSGNPIEQETRLMQIPLTTSLKFYPLARGRRVGRYAWVRSTWVPYLGGGIGATWYQLKQKGDFVDLMTLTIFGDEREFSGWAFSQHLFAGIDLKVTRNFGLVLEARYHWARGNLGGDFSSFDSIDLNGARIMAGFSWRL